MGRKSLLFLIAIFIMIFSFGLVACYNQPDVSEYYLDSNGNLVAEFEDGSTKDLGTLGDTIANGVVEIEINSDGFYVVNDIVTEIQAKLPESYAIDTNGNLIVTYTDTTTENLGKFGSDAINTINTIAVSDDGFYVLNGIKTDIVAIEVYDVTFNTGFSANVSKQTIKDGYKVERPEIERTGYTLNGWYCNGEEWRFNSDIVKSDMVLTADWTANEYTVSFDSNGGGEIDSFTIKTGEELILPIPEKPLYSFEGWLYNGIKVTSATLFGFATNINLVASWNRTQYTVTFDTAGGEAIEPIKVDSFAQILELPIPLKSEFEFLGWYVNGNKIELPYDFTEGNLTLTAHWRGISEDWEFIEDDNGTGITLLEYKGDDLEVIVPATLGGKYITTISKNCFENNDYIKSIKFHSNVTNFDFKSINGCDAIETLTISSDLEVDIVYIFGGENNIPTTLKNICFCEGSINADSSVFANLTTRKFELWTNSDLKVLKEDAFYRCNAITKLHLNEGLTKIETTAIWDMDYLTYVNIPSTVTNIGWSNFGNCPELLYLIAPKTIKTTTHQSLVASESIVLVEYESMPLGWDSTTFGYDTTSSKMNIFYGFEKIVETEDFLYALCKVGNTKRCIIIQRYDSNVEYPETIEDYPVVFTNNNYTKAK